MLYDECLGLLDLAQQGQGKWCNAIIGALIFISTHPDAE